MVICFTKHLLDQKHQLSRIWLAAHWENKIKRAQICEVDIEKSVQDMMEAEIILDLRVSGHLLVGIVKIHSRKSKYLLSECNSIFYQIKVFRTGTIDLPKNKKLSVIENITLTEFFDNFNVKNAKDDAILTVNQSHVEEITLKETSERLTLWDDNDIVDYTVNEEETFENFDESLLSFEGSLEIVKDLNLVVEKKQIAEKKQQKISKSQKLIPKVNHEALDICNDAGVFDINLTDQETAINEIPETQCISNDDIQRSQLDEFDISSTKAVDILSLEPLKILSINTLKARKSKKRKLCVDDKKSLSIAVVKKHMLDTSDIMGVYDFAPTTKRLMDLKKTGCAENLLSVPFFKLQSNKLLKMKCLEKNPRVICLKIAH